MRSFTIFFSFLVDVGICTSIRDPADGSGVVLTLKDAQNGYHVSGHSSEEKRRLEREFESSPVVGLIEDMKRMFEKYNEICDKFGLYFANFIDYIGAVSELDKNRTELDRDWDKATKGMMMTLPLVAEEAMSHCIDLKKLYKNFDKEFHVRYDFVMTDVMRALQSWASISGNRLVSFKKAATVMANSAKEFSELKSIQKNVNHPNYKRLTKFHENMTLIDSGVIAEYRKNFQFQRLLDSMETEFREMEKKAIEEIARKTTAADLADYNEVSSTMSYLTNQVVERIENDAVSEASAQPAVDTAFTMISQPTPLLQKSCFQKNQHQHPFQRPHQMRS